MASLHFPACEEYARRVIRMGEDPATGESGGGLGEENLRKMKLLSRADWEKSIDFSLEQPYALVTYHPETAGGASPVGQFDELLHALENVPLHVIFTKANADAGGADINRRIDEICALHPQRYKAVSYTHLDEDKPLGTGGGLSLLKGRIDSTVFLTNCDILVDADFGDIYKFHKEGGNAITMVCAVKHFTIPYGVVAVSYTHLDVYKRQEFSFWGIAPKVVKSTGQLYTFQPQGLRVTSYVPGLVMLDEAFQFLGTSFAPWKVFAAYDILMFAIFAAGLLSLIHI